MALTLSAHSNMCTYGNHGDIKQHIPAKPAEIWFYLTIIAFMASCQRCTRDLKSNILYNILYNI